MVVFISTSDIFNIGFMIWTRRDNFPKGNYHCSQTEPRIIIQRLFELTYNKYDQTKDDITSMEHVDYNYAIVWNFMNEHDLEDFFKFILTLISN